MERKEFDIKAFERFYEKNKYKYYFIFIICFIAFSYLMNMKLFIGMNLFAIVYSVVMIASMIIEKRVEENKIYLDRYFWIILYVSFVLLVRGG